MKNLKKEIRDARTIEVFRCSCTLKGEKCPCEFTRMHAFVPMLKTLWRKNPGGVTLDTIVSSAICAFHARMLGYVRTDIVRMEQALAEFVELTSKARKHQQRQQQWQEDQQRRQRWLSRRTSPLAEKLKAVL
jgi:hypothetical protein